MEASQDEDAETGKHIHTSHAWQQQGQALRGWLCHCYTFSPGPRHLHPTLPHILSNGIHSALVTGQVLPNGPHAQGM